MLNGNFYIETLVEDICNMCRYVCMCALNVIQENSIFSTSSDIYDNFTTTPSYLTKQV